MGWVGAAKQGRLKNSCKPIKPNSTSLSKAVRHPAQSGAALPLAVWCLTGISGKGPSDCRGVLPSCSFPREKARLGRLSCLSFWLGDRKWTGCSSRRWRFRKLQFFPRKEPQMDPKGRPDPSWLPDWTILNQLVSHLIDGRQIRRGSCSCSFPSQPTQGAKNIRYSLNKPDCLCHFTGCIPGPL